MDWKPSTLDDQGHLIVPKRWLHPHYYEALNILFRFENSLRVFVFSILKNEFQEQWSRCSFAIGDGEQTSIAQIANKRISHADNFGYLGFDILAPLMHLTSGELVELIVNESYWPKFRSHFRGNKEIIKNKLLEIGSIRNSLAHFRPIKAEDIELIKQNSRHTLLGVEECLKSVFNQTIRVPTNTDDDWYRSVSTLGTENINTIPYYSKNEEWVCIVPKFAVPTLEKRSYGGDFFSYSMVKLNTPKILNERPNLSKNLTYISEYTNYPTLSDDFEMEIEKDIRLVFRKDILIDNHEIISAEIRDTLALVAEECELLQKDNLARGKIVETARTTAIWQATDGKEGRWHFQYGNLEQAYLSEHPDEYWGQLAGNTDVVAGSHRYPWMPEDISTPESWMD